MDNPTRRLNPDYREADNMDTIKQLQSDVRRLRAQLAERDARIEELENWLRAIPLSLGAEGPTENDVMGMGWHYGAWENGFSTCVDIVRNRCRAALNGGRDG